MLSAVNRDSRIDSQLGMDSDSCHWLLGVSTTKVNRSTRIIKDLDLLGRFNRASNLGNGRSDRCGLGNGDNDGGSTNLGLRAEVRQMHSLTTNSGISCAEMRHTCLRAVLAGGVRVQSRQGPRVGWISGLDSADSYNLVSEGRSTGQVNYDLNRACVWCL